MFQFDPSRAGTVIEKSVFLPSAYSSTCLFQHHTQWSFCSSNQTSFMTIWIGMNDTSMVLLVYVPVWSIQGRNCNQKRTFTGSVWFNLQLYFSTTPNEASLDPTKLLYTIWIGMNDTSMVLLVYVPVWSIQGRNCNQKWNFTTPNEASAV